MESEFKPTDQQLQAFIAGTASSNLCRQIEGYVRTTPDEAESRIEGLANQDPLTQRLGAAFQGLPPQNAEKKPSREDSVADPVLSINSLVAMALLFLILVAMAIWLWFA